MVNFMPPPVLRGRTKTIKVFLESASLLLLSSGQSASINVISIVHSRKIMAQGQGIWNTVKWMNCVLPEKEVYCCTQMGQEIPFLNSVLTVPLVPLKRRGILFLHQWVSWLVCRSVELSTQYL